MFGVRPNSPVTTTIVLSNMPRSERSVSNAVSDSSRHGKHQPMPYEPLPKALPMPISPPCMSQLEAGGPPPPLGDGPVQPLTVTKPTPDSTNRRARSRFCPSGCMP